MMNKDLQKEILNIKKASEAYTEQELKWILTAYKRSLDEVRAEIAQIYVKYAVDGALQVSKQQRYTILKQLEKQLIEQARVLGHIDVDYTTKILESVYSDSYYETAFTIDKGIVGAINMAILKPEFVKTAISMPIEGVMYSDRIWANKEKLVNRVRNTLEKAMIQGLSIDKLSRDISKNFGSTAFESMRLVRTEVARCQSAAQADIYKQSGVVQRVMYDATLDSKTSSVCQGLDGQYFNVHSNYPKPPQHPNCRSAIIPIVEGWSPTKKRDNQNKEIINYQVFDEWKKSKGI